MRFYAVTKLCVIHHYSLTRAPASSLRFVANTPAIEIHFLRFAGYLRNREVRLPQIPVSANSLTTREPKKYNRSGFSNETKKPQTEYSLAVLQLTKMKKL